MNLFDLDGLPFDEEFCEELVSNEKLRIERIVSKGHVSPEGFWYDQDESEWVTLLAGSAVIEFEDGSTVGLERGGTLMIEKHKKHRVIETSVQPEAIWLAVFWG